MCGKRGGNHKPKYTKADFIEKAVEKFGNKFDYSLVDYVNNKTKINIICPIHGIFNTLPNSFQQSENGCVKCGKEVRDIKNTSNRDEFITKAKLVHGDDKFDYSKVEYINSYTNVEIICKEHGSFFQRPDNHINKPSICPKCSKSNVSNKRRSTKKIKTIEKSLAEKKRERHFIEYVNKCNLKFENIFDYSNSKYINNRSELEIICKLHGKFFQKADYHYKSRYGCIKCAKDQEIDKYKKPINSWTYTQWEAISKISKVFNEFICYIIKCSNTYETFYKIGKTFKKINIRFYRKSDMPYDYEIVKIFRGDSRKISELEHLLQNMSKDNKYIPNISFKGMYECFSDLNEDVLNYEFLN